MFDSWGLEKMNAMTYVCPKGQIDTLPTLIFFNKPTPRLIRITRLARDWLRLVLGLGPVHKVA